MAAPLHVIRSLGITTSEYPVKNMLLGSGFAYMWMDINTRRIIASHLVYRMLGVDAYGELITERLWHTYVHPQDLFKLLQAEEALLTLQQPTTIEYRLITKSRREIVINHHMQLLSDSEGRRRIISTLEDISEQKRADVILETINEGFFELDNNLIFRRINAKAEAFFAIDRYLLLDKPFLDVFPDIEESLFYKVLQRASKERENLSRDVVWPLNGHALHMSISPFADGLVVLFYDIQVQKTAEEIIRLRERQYHSLLENMPDVITRWSPKGDLIYANKAFEAITGISLPGADGKSQAGNQMNEDTAFLYEDSLKEVMHTGLPVEHLGSFKSDDGEASFYSRLVPEKNEKDVIVSILAIARDITELQKAQQEVLRLKDALAQRASDKYKAIFSSIHEGFALVEMIYIEGKPVDFKFLEANPAFQKHTGHVGLRSKSMQQLDPEGAMSWVEKLQEAIDLGESVSFEKYYPSTQRWYNVSASGFGRENSRKVFILLNDITGHKHRELRTSVMMELQEALARVTTANEIIRVFGEKLGNSLQMAAIYFALINEITDEASFHAIWYTPGSNAVHFPPVIRMHDFANDAFLEVLRSGETGVSTNTQGDARMNAEACRVMGLQSLIVIPFHQGAEWKYVLAVSDTVPREWVKDEIELFRELAELFFPRLERAYAEDALRKREMELARVQRLGRVAGLDIDLTGEPTGYRSPEYVLVHGLRPGITMESQEDWLARVHPDDRKKANETFFEAINSDNATYEAEYRIIRPIDGEERWIYTKNDIERDENGKAIRMVGAHIDITERKINERALRESRRLLRERDKLLTNITDLTPSLLSRCSRDLRYLFVNRTTARFVGLKRKEIVGKPIRGILGDKAMDAIMPYIQRVLAGEKVEFELEIPYETVGKKYVNVFYVPDINEMGDVVGWYATVNDITERRKIEEALQASEQQLKDFNVSLENLVKIRTGELKASKDMLQTVYDTTINAYSVFEAVRNHRDEVIDFRYISQNILSLQHEHGDHTGKLFREVHRSESSKELFNKFKSVMDTSVPVDFELRYKNTDGEGWYRVIAVRVGEGLVSAGEDITERKNSELKIQEQNLLITKLTEMIPDIIGVSEVESQKVLFVNREPLALLGFDLDILLKMSEEERSGLVHPDDLKVRDEYRKEIAMKMDDGILSYESRARNNKGEWLWFNTRGRVFERNEDGSPKSVVSIIQNITEQRLADEKIKEQNQFITSVTDTIPDMISVVEYPSQKLLYMNREAFSLQGFDSEDLEKMTVEEMQALMHPDDIASGQEYFNSLASMSNDEVTTLEYRAKNKNGDWLSLRSRSKVFQRDKDGNVISVVNVIQNITEQVKAEQKILEQHQLIVSVTDTVPDLISVLELPSRNFLFYNREPFEMYGFDPEEMEAMTEEERKNIVHVDDQLAVQQYFDRVASLSDNSITMVEYRARNNSGKWMWFRARGRVFDRAEDGKPISCLNVIQDITERMEIERAIIEKNVQLETFERISESAHDAIMSLDEDGHVVTWNPATEKLFGYTAAEMIGQHEAKILVPDNKLDELADIFARARSGQSVVDLYTKRVRKNGEVLDVQLTIFPLRKEGAIVGYCKIIRNITELLRAQENIKDLNHQLRVKNRQLVTLNSELKTFNQIASHNYGETLRNIYLNLEHALVTDSKNISSGSRAHLRKAQSAMQKMKMLTEDIVAYTKLNELEGVVEKIDLSVLVKTVLEDLNEKINEHHAFIDCKDLPMITGYPELIMLLLRHLIDNALKFRKENSSPRITISCEALNLIQMASGDKQKAAVQYVVLSITDDGIGVALDDIDKIFETFTRLNDDNKYRGSGIGLAICKKIMELHEGFITAESEPGVGTTFKCYFPIVE